ncbi:hypothetical protein LTR85_002530 [Meristemomyces frigidus]|nr:hypothetical protein LTR85_002530 [Meristemomyces frigidus]
MAPPPPPPPRESLRQKTERIRREMMEQYRNETEEWQQWRDNYQTLLRQHEAGIDPGFGARWNSAWTREQFDVEHLARARRLTQKAVVTGKVLNDLLPIAKKLKLEPMDWQITQFPQGPRYYIESQENGMIARAPAAQIYRWASQLPSDPGDFGRPLLDIDPIPVGDAGYHPVEYPDDMDVIPDRDVEPWDSTTEIALKYTRPLIDANQPAGWPGRTATGDQKAEQDRSKMYLSHWF